MRMGNRIYRELYELSTDIVFIRPIKVQFPLRLVEVFRVIENASAIKTFNRDFNHYTTIQFKTSMLQTSSLYGNSKQMEF